MPTITDNLNLFKPDPGQSGVAAELNTNWDVLDGRFDEATGHTHSGAEGEGPKIPVTSIAATGTPSADTVLRGDGHWGTGGGGGAGVTDHADLTGLTDDDHPQYMNQSRGDTRYTQRANNLSDVSSASTARTNLGAAASVHQHDAADITTGTIATARLGSGSGGLDKFLRIDQTWAVPGAGGSVNLDDLADVLITSPADNQVLSYDAAGSRWINEAPSGGGSTLDALTDVTITTPATNQLLSYNGSQWVNAAPAAGGSVATDVIWDAAGDLAIGSGANTASRLALGAAGTVLTSTGAAAAWQAPAGGSSVDAVTTLTLVDDFLVALNTTGSIGKLGWAQAGGSAGGKPGSANHPGVYERASGASINTICNLFLDNNTMNGQISPADTFDVTWIIRLVSNDANTLVRAGLVSSTANPAPNGVYVEKLDADTSWFGVTRAATAQTRTAALAACSTNFVKLRARRVNGTTIGFSVDGGTELTLTATIPTGPITPIVQLVNTAAANKTIEVDLFSLTISGLVR